MEIKELFTKTNQALNDIVVQVKPEQMDAVMPKHASYNDGQTLKTHINICAHENACVPAMLAGEHLPTNQENTKDYLQDDFQTNYSDLTKSANEAVLKATDQDLQKIVHMSYGDAVAKAYLSDIVLQRSAAAIDIAQVAGVSFTWSDDLVQGIWDIAAPNAAMLREYGIFPPEVTVDDTASLQDKLIGLMGRRP